MYGGVLRTLFAACWICSIIAGSSELAAQQTISVTKEQLVGTWKLVSWEQFEPNGSTSPALVGTNIAGMLMFDAAGNFSLQMILRAAEMGHRGPHDWNARRKCG